MPWSFDFKRFRRRKVKPKLDGPKGVKVGFVRGVTKTAVINRAIFNEFGTRRIPERPFMRNAVRNNRVKYMRALRVSAPKLLLGETDMRTVMSKLGALAQGDIQHEITVLMYPPNAPSTIKNKGSSKPLIDTGEMRQAVTWLLINDPQSR